MTSLRPKMLGNWPDKGESPELLHIHSFTSGNCVQVKDRARKLRDTNQPLWTLAKRHQAQVKTWAAEYTSSVCMNSRCSPFPSSQRRILHFLSKLASWHPWAERHLLLNMFKRGVTARNYRFQPSCGRSVHELSIKHRHTDDTNQAPSKHKTMKRLRALKSTVLQHWPVGGIP